MCRSAYCMDERRQTVECKRGARTVVLLQTHYLNRTLLRMFSELSCAMPETAAIVLMHLPPDRSKPHKLARIPHHFVTTPEIREPAYVRKSDGPGWAIWRGGHVDLIALHFFRKYPCYAYYWIIEYDVRFSGEWRAFLTAFQDSDADLLSTSIRRASNDPNWMYWPSLHPPEGVRPLAADEMLCSFMPIYRISHRGLRLIDQAYRDGWTGHCEAVWPTVLHHSGYRLEDIGGNGEFVRPGNINRFYTNNPSDPELAPGSLVFRPVRWMPGSSRNRLWHPVKPLAHKLREDARHAWVSLKPYLPWRRPVVDLPSLHPLPCAEEATRDPS